ncbi:uncharacterized protein LOC120280607 [Dioscorea cayenensis subsp. rotundata]|uniref:Uncharacterized protein LOC120280607 n=1 Tax=Dioscorea cayennensis subsp. rotundata TaxID=55577 RepID=A0AB40CZF5_DIOCR|nr:uncharacterized protein LOC120280607 [Dioscorea cayenensis subsp. rotundata]
MPPSFSSASSDKPHHHGLNLSFESLASSVLSRLPFPKPSSPPVPSSTSVTVPLVFPFNSFYQDEGRGRSSPSPAIRNLASSVRIDGLSSGSKGVGPAFVGQVFSMLDPSGNGLMAVTTHFDIPFLTKRAPAWVKKMLANVTRSEKNGPVFRFFMDLTDAVTYVKKLNVPTGMVGACRLDVAYEHFKEKPHMFQFVPNEKQVKAANKLLKAIPQRSGKKKLDGVPVFTAENLNIAIATNDGIKWYTPYFFDKSLLDNILEASIDQHFHTLIQTRHSQRRRDVIDDSLTSEMFEENGDSLFEPPEVQEVLDEMGHSSIPLSIISKAAEIQLLDVVDKVLLGNKWLRKATGIQPKFPYMVDSFEERSAASLAKAALSTSSSNNSEGVDITQSNLGVSNLKSSDGNQGDRRQSSSHTDFRFPFGNWLPNPLSLMNRKKQKPEIDRKSKTRARGSNTDNVIQTPPNPLLPKITMVGISMGDGQASISTLKKTMENLTRELETSQKSAHIDEDKDPLFVANVGDYSSITRMNSS